MNENWEENSSQKKKRKIPLKNSFYMSIKCIKINLLFFSINFIQKKRNRKALQFQFFFFFFWWMKEKEKLFYIFFHSTQTITKEKLINETRGKSVYINVYIGFFIFRSPSHSIYQNENWEKFNRVFLFFLFSVYGCDELPVFLFSFPFTAKIKFVSGGKFLVDTFTRLKSRFCEWPRSALVKWKWIFYNF